MPIVKRVEKCFLTNWDNLNSDNSISMESIISIHFGLIYFTAMSRGEMRSLLG